MEPGALGKEYADKEAICCEGERGDCMFVIQSGCAEALRSEDGAEIVIGDLSAGDIFGEMAIFDRQPRSATVGRRDRHACSPSTSGRF
jgi:CRP-like cAMP-binding protein